MISSGEGKNPVFLSFFLVGWCKHMRQKQNALLQKEHAHVVEKKRLLSE